MIFQNELISALILAVIQGITEWLPVSSSGHLVLAEKILDFKGGLQFDVTLHLGTLMAVFVYFGKDIMMIIEDLAKRKWHTENSRLGFLIIIATIPAAIIGFIFNNIVEIAFSSLGIVAIGFSITALLLWITAYSKKPKKNKKIKIREAIIVGIAQIFALFPGISRSGTTIAAGILSGLSEKDAMKFSFLISIPIIFGASIFEIGNQRLQTSLIWATLVSFIVGLISINLLYKKILTNKKNLFWFGLYLFILAIAIGFWLIVN